MIVRMTVFSIMLALLLCLLGTNSPYAFHRGVHCTLRACFAKSTEKILVNSSGHLHPGEGVCPLLSPLGDRDESFLSA